MTTDAEVADQIERADCFIEQLLAAITAMVVDPACRSPTLSWRDSAERRDAGRGAVRDDVQSGELRQGDARRADADHEVHLLAVGGGPALDYTRRRSSPGSRPSSRRCAGGGSNEGLIYGLDQGLAAARQARCGKTGRGVVWLAKAGGINATSNR